MHMGYIVLVFHLTPLRCLETLICSLVLNMCMYNITQLCNIIDRSGKVFNPQRNQGYTSHTLQSELFTDCGLGSDQGSVVTEEIVCGGGGETHIDVGPRTRHICILLSGGPVIFHQKQEYTMSAGDCVLIHSKQLHSARAVSGGTARFMCVQYAHNDIPQHMLAACVNT